MSFMLSNKAHVMHKRKFQLSADAGPFDFLTIDNIRPLLRSTIGKQHVSIVKDMFFKLTRAIPSGRISSMQIATRLLNNWSMQYGIPSYVLADIGPQFVSKLFTTLCLFLRVKRLTNKAATPEPISKDAKRGNDKKTVEK